MPVARNRAPIHAALLATILTAAPALVAQLPEGQAVVGTFADPTQPGTSGLFRVPLTGGSTTPIRISGVPAAVGHPGGGFKQGVASVSYRSADGALVVGTVAQAGGPTAGNVEL